MTLKLDYICQEPLATAHACVIWLHGLGADGHDFAGIVPQLNLPPNHGIRFIFPHAPIRPVTLNGGVPMRAWYDIYQLGDLNHQDQQGIETSESLISKIIEQQTQAGISSNAIFLCGFSQGGAMALHTALRHQEPLAGVIALSCYLPLHQSFAQKRSQANQNIKIFQAHGEYDDIVPIQAGLMTRELLRATGYNVEWHSYPMGHEVCIEEIHALAKVLVEKRKI